MTQTPHSPSVPPHKPHSRGFVAVMVACMLVILLGAALTVAALRNSAVLPSAQSIAEQKAEPTYSYKNAAGSYLSGHLAATHGDVKKALHSVGEAMAYQHAPELLREAYRLSVLAGDFEQAGNYSEKLTDFSQDQLLNPSLLKVVLAIKKSDFTKADTLIDRMVVNGANALFLPLLRGWVTLGHGDPLDIPALERGIAKAGQFAPLLNYQAALLLDAAGKPEEAATYYDKVLDKNDLSYRSAVVLASFYQRSHQEAKLAQVLDRYEQEYKHPLGTVAAEPVVATPRQGAAEIFYGISSVLFALEAYQEAQIPLRIAADLRPDFDAVHFLQANLLERLKKYDEAIKAYKALIHHPAFGLQAQLRIAYCYQDAEKPHKAIQWLEKLIASSPQEVEPQVALADTLRGEQKYHEAAEAYSKALLLFNKDESRYWPVLYARGICYERMNDWKKAEADFLEALRMEPDQPDVLNYLGYSWLIQRKHLQQAKEMIEKAMAMRPHDAHIIDSMGWAMFQLGEYDDSLEYLEQAATLAPRDPTVNEHLGDVYWRLGYQLQARYQWERALLFDPQEPGQRKALRHKIADGLPDEPAAARKMVSQNLMR